jgi:hyperosmotically inducible protein
MKSLVLLLAILSVTVFIAGGCTAAKNTGTAVKEGTEEVADKTEDAAEKVADKTTDASITSAIKMKLANDDLTDALDIDVDTSNGMVTLKGTVSSQAEADRAVELARAVDGVKDVQSQLHITAEPQH